MAKSKGFTASEGHIRERLKMLHYIGFVGKIYGRMYELDRDGQLYLKGKAYARMK